MLFLWLSLIVDWREAATTRAQTLQSEEEVDVSNSSSLRTNFTP
jgi:hypothetical protein